MSWLRDNNVLVGTIVESDLILGKFDIVSDFVLVNHILLLGKYYISCRRCLNGIPTLIRPVGRGGAMGAPAPPPQTAEVHFFVKKINSKKKNNSVVLFAKMHPRRLELGTLLKDRDDQQPAE